MHENGRRVIVFAILATTFVQFRTKINSLLCHFIFAILNNHILVYSRRIIAHPMWQMCKMAKIHLLNNLKKLLNLIWFYGIKNCSF